MRFCGVCGVFGCARWLRDCSLFWKWMRILVGDVEFLVILFSSNLVLPIIVLLVIGFLLATHATCPHFGPEKTTLGLVMRSSRIDTNRPRCWRSRPQDRCCTSSALRRRCPRSSRDDGKFPSYSPHHLGRLSATCRMSGCLRSSSQGLSLSLEAVASKALSAQLVRGHSKLDLF